MMYRRRVFTALALAAALLVPAGTRALAQQETQPPALTPAEKEAERAARLTLAADALDKLYKLQPDAKAVIEKAPGYAVFDISAIYAILLVGQKGKGVLFDNTTKKPIFMLSNRIGTGPGVGKQRVYQVFVFKTKGAMDQFILAGGTGGDIGASVGTGKDGSVYSFNPQIDVYQIPLGGMAVQASWGGTLYSVDTQLK
jgi:lipid-binding SYLF domain-containing protein